MELQLLRRSEKGHCDSGFDLKEERMRRKIPGDAEDGGQNRAACGRICAALRKRFVKEQRILRGVVL